MAQKNKIRNNSKAKGNKPKRKKSSHGKKLSKKNNLVKILPAITIIMLLAFIGLLAYHYRAIPLITKAIVKPRNTQPLDINDIIAKVANEIGVDDRNFSVLNEKDDIFIKIGINPAIWDLPLVNSILTGKVESAGGNLVSSKEIGNGNYHLLQFKHKNNKKPYLIKIYYGKYTEASPEIFLIIDDFGSYHNKLLQEFCLLDEEVNFSILPNELYYREVMEQAYQSGHDILIHMPMEPIDIKNNNPGEDAILVHYNAAKIKALVKEYIKRIPLAIAANNHMGSLATSQVDIMRPVLQILKQNDLIFIDSYTSANSVVSQVAKEEMMQTWQRDLFLDDQDLTDKVLTEKINSLINIAKRKDQVFVISHSHSKVKLEFVQKFIEQAKANGFRFSAISTLKKTREVTDA